MIRNGFLFFALAGLLSAQNFVAPVVDGFQAAEGTNTDYQNGQRELDARQWDQAISSFTAAAAHKRAFADAALYWKAYAENRAGRREQALSTIADLRQAYPSSKWVRDAQALEVEVRAQVGTPVNPSSEPDEDLKLIALNGLMESDPNTALPILQKLLASNNSLKVKDRALFILTQSGSPEARRILDEVARESSNPDLQLKAIRYMGMMGGDESRKELASLYSSSSNEIVKREILKSFMVSGSRAFLLNAAKTEKNPELRREAIKELALSGGQEELWQLYQTGSFEDKQEILKSMFLSGNSARLVEVARSEKNPALRVAAIKSLGLMGSNGRGDVLVSIYQSDTNPEVREAVLNALFLQQNGKALVDLARSEKNSQMKEEIVKKMALVHSKETTAYMMELLK